MDLRKIHSIAVRNQYCETQIDPRKIHSIAVRNQYYDWAIVPPHARARARNSHVRAGRALIGSIGPPTAGSAPLARPPVARQ